VLRGQGPTHRTRLPADPDGAARVLGPTRYLRPTAGAWGRGAAPVWAQAVPPRRRRRPAHGAADQSAASSAACPGRLYCFLILPACWASGISWIRRPALKNQREQTEVKSIAAASVFVSRDRECTMRLGIESQSRERCSYSRRAFYACAQSANASAVSTAGLSFHFWTGGRC
jgi:hypothetical protein